MRKLFKFAMMFAMAGMMATGFTACSSSDDDNDDKFSDRTYGQNAIDECANVVTQLENANKVISPPT